MPAPAKFSKAQFETSWEDIRLAEEEYSEYYRARIEWRGAWVRYSAKSKRKYLFITCFAIRGDKPAKRVIGRGDCGFRVGRGAASVPAAYLRSMIDACEDLERKAADPVYARDNPAELFDW